MTPKYTAEQKKELRRELAFRLSAYPREIAKGRMTRRQADERIEIMREDRRGLSRPGRHQQRTPAMTESAPSPFLVLQARAEARAILYAAGEFESVEQAIAPLLDDAQAIRLADSVGAETVFAIIRNPFAER